MNSLSLMEWNSKSPIQWDWENLIMFNSTENPKKLQLAAEWEIDDEKGVDSASFYSSGTGSGTGGSNTGSGSLSKSASINSSNFTLEVTQTIPEDSNCKKVFTAKPTGACSSTVEGSVGSGEPLLGLKLGKRTYFEDVCAKTAAVSVAAGSSDSPVKKCKSGGLVMPGTRCQVEGCNLELSLAKDYHRKHRVCEAHSKCPKVVIAGLERRFCQQCSRFHGLSEFDEKKRSCRRRLSDHNARRRKPQPESIRLNPARLPSSLYDERQQISLGWNGVPLVHSRPNANFSWEGTSCPKFTITKEYAPKPAKIGGIDGQLHLPVNEPTAIPTHLHDSKSLLPSKAKVLGVEALNPGSEESMISPNVDATQDLHSALSLLSMNSWGSKSISHQQPPQMSHHTAMPHSMLHTVPQSLPLASSDYWRTEQQITDSRVKNLASQDDGSGYFQEFQLLRGPFDNDFYSDQLN
ncbi:squamosa promoter-binding-like protein 2 [Mercurialis annua]|uniref:squamosa promoter-binding-like protein 2 n=1 Tax=Mercurialis annua TaxID=3986 RepID=UPI00215E049B|nr:squamosa promoter-binding-like protein 2 [Mercurialis annua]XP_050204737.1 squamosa promoter-binding-like protein 2 [Mercurialis annua]